MSDREQKPFTPDSFFMNTMDTCFLLRLGKNINVRKEPFQLAGGDILEAGDEFTRIDKKGSAGNQPITLTPPWVQRYEGPVTVPKDDSWYPEREMVLFSAFIPDGTDRFVSVADNEDAYGVEDGYYIAYLRHCSNMLFHIRSSGSSSVAKCEYLERYPS